MQWIRRMTVLEFHRMVQAWLGGDDGGMAYQTVTERGDFKISPKLEKKIDRVFQMQHSWEIHPDSLKVLTRGPLLNADGTEVLVPAHGVIASFVNWVDGSPLIKVIGFVLSFLVILGNIFGIY